MTESKINQFFPPLTPRSVKRLRPYSSPNSEDSEGQLDASMENEKVGDLTQAQLTSVLSSLLDEKLSKLASKEDFINLSGQVAVLTDENKALKEEIMCLKRQEKNILHKLTDLESRSRRNNLIFRGLSWTAKSPDFKEVVKKFCCEMFGSSDRLWINRAHLLSKGSGAVIAHLPDDSDIEYIMSRVKHLKGTGYSVQRDFAAEVRQKRACLASVRREVERVAGSRRMPLVHDHLTVDGRRFTWEDGMLRMGKEDGAEQLRKMFDHNFNDFLAELKKGRPTQSTRQNETPRQNLQRPAGQQGEASTHAGGAAQATDSTPMEG